MQPQYGYITVNITAPCFVYCFARRGGERWHLLYLPSGSQTRSQTMLLTSDAASQVEAAGDVLAWLLKANWWLLAAIWGSDETCFREYWELSGASAWLWHWSDTEGAGTEQGSVAAVTVTRRRLCLLQTLVGIQPRVTGGLRLRAAAGRRRVHSCDSLGCHPPTPFFFACMLLFCVFSPCGKGSM